MGAIPADHDREIGFPLSNSLQCAAYNGHCNIIDLLLENFADPNTIAGDCGTALHAAAFHGGTQVMKHLMNKGANPDIKAGRFGFALNAAACGGNRDNIRLLIENISPSSPAELRAISESFSRQTSDNVRNAMLNALVLRTQGSYCRSLLDAAKIGAVESVHYFINNGADLEARDPITCRTALGWACFFGHFETAQILLDAGAAVYEGDRHAWQPLFWPCKHGDLELVKLLISRGADLNARNSAIRTPLMVAQMNGHDHIVDYITTHRK